MDHPALRGRTSAVAPQPGTSDPLPDARGRPPRGCRRRQALPCLGLDFTTWQRLAEAVDLIVDPAALVNHMLPYPQLFGPNVVGTAELIRLALTTRMKAITYVSSVGVGAAPLQGELTEDADIRKICPSRPVDAVYASGYATSKWASEVLLRDAHDRFALPVGVFRCDMLMAETRYRGQLNLPDLVTRLILSLAATGVAPESFYLPDETGRRARSHFDGFRNGERSRRPTASAPRSRRPRSADTAPSRTSTR